ncbi:MAG TPA: flippase [Thermoleophilaceae bacterium]|nr:flippase [Thermoleophilaceae bacterium]
MSSTRRLVASNTAVQVGGKAAVLAIGLVSIAVITRYLGPDDYGRYTLALTYMQLFAVLADVGLFTIVVRDISRDPERTEELVGNTLTLRLLLSAAVIVVAAAISLLLPYDEDVRVAILLAGLPLLFGMLNSTFVAVLQSRLRMGRAVAGDVLGRAVALGAVALVAALDLGFYAVMGAAAAGALVTALTTMLLTGPLARLRPRADPAVWRALLRTALPLGLALAVNELYFRADTLIISLYEPYEQVGLYTLAYRMLELTLVFGTVFLTTTFPLLSQAVANDEPRARRTIQLSTELFVVLGAPLVAGGLAVAPELVELAAGDDFEDAATPLRILLAAGALAWINGVFGYALIAKDRQMSALWLNVTALVFNVGLNLLLVPRYGIVVAAAVTVASEVLILAGSYVLMRRYFDFFPAPRTLVPAVVAAAAMGGLLWLLRDAPVVALLPLGAALYAGLLWVTSPASRELVAGVRA